MPGISQLALNQTPWWDSLTLEQKDQALAWVRENQASPTRTVSDEATAYVYQREIAQHYGWQTAAS